MINFNAAQISLTAIGLPVQQNSNNIPAGNNNFQALITDILNNQVNSERADIAAALSADPAAKTALFESVSMLYLLGKIDSVAKLSTGEITNDPAVKAAIQNNNLNPEQVQLLANGIKITAMEISSGNIQALNYNLPAQPQANISGAVPAQQLNPVPVSQPAPAVNAAVAQPLPAVPAAVVNYVPASQPQVIPVAPNNASAVIASQPQAASSQSPVIPAVVAAPSAASVAPAIPVQTGNEPAAVLPAAAGNTIKPVIPAAVNPAVKPEPIPVVLNTLSGKLQAVSNSGVSIDKAAIDEINKLVAELQVILKDFTALIYKLTEKGEDVPEEAKIINNKVTELANKLNELNTTAVENGKLVKTITNQAADILGVIAVALYRIAESYLNTAAVKGATDSGLDQPAVTLNYGTGAKQDYSNGRQITIAAGLSEEAKDLITQIYSMLKKMNGELYMQQKTDYVYKPFSGSSSQVTKDGVLLINTAITSGSPAAVVNNIEAGGVQPPPVNVSLQAAAFSAQPSVIPGKPAVTAAPVTGPSGEADGSAPSQPVSQTVIIPPVRNSEKADMLLSETKNNYIKDVNWLKGSVTAFAATVTDTKDAQLPVAVKVFEKAADFAGKVKENIVIKQVVQNIQDAVQVTGKTEIKMFLRPENMGPVIIKLDSRDNVITGRIEVANTDVKDILKVNLPELRAALSNIGLNVSTLDVSIMSGYIGSGLSDSTPDGYNEWEGSAMRPDAEETLENAGAINGVDGYLNFLA